jgi:hypothetical protein
MSQSKEEIYDEQISPLMLQIIAICQAADIKMLSSYALVDADGEELACTTALLEGLPEGNPLMKALRTIKPPVRSFAFAITTSQA